MRTTAGGGGSGGLMLKKDDKAGGGRAKNPFLWTSFMDDPIHDELFLYLTVCRNYSVFVYAIILLCLSIL